MGVISAGIFTEGQLTNTPPGATASKDCEAFREGECFENNRMTEEFSDEELLIESELL